MDMITPQRARWRKILAVAAFVAGIAVPVEAAAIPLQLGRGGVTSAVLGDIALSASSSITISQGPHVTAHILKPASWLLVLRLAQRVFLSR